MKIKDMSSIHPGKILLNEFIEPMGISQSRFAQDINVPFSRIQELSMAKAP